MIAIFLMLILILIIAYKLIMQEEKNYVWLALFAVNMLIITQMIDFYYK